MLKQPLHHAAILNTSGAEELRQLRRPSPTRFCRYDEEDEYDRRPVNRQRRRPLKEEPVYEDEDEDEDECECHLPTFTRR